MYGQVGCSLQGGIDCGGDVVIFVDYVVVEVGDYFLVYQFGYVGCIDLYWWFMCGGVYWYGFGCVGFCLVDEFQVGYVLQYVVVVVLVGMFWVGDWVV